MAAFGQKRTLVPSVGHRMSGRGNTHPGVPTGRRAWSDASAKRVLKNVAQWLDAPVRRALLNATDDFVVAVADNTGSIDPLPGLRRAIEPERWARLKERGYV
ncbi:hypothetical protein [Marilutibacter maris]|uniref:hypothetical protein n=1 Tax=Marilutibacter maris TaxID=1605891 RepID=UPI0011AE9E67|nr:hypothetical protein [Lysobacter maris]